MTGRRAARLGDFFRAIAGRRRTHVVQVEARLEAFGTGRTISHADDVRAERSGAQVHQQGIALTDAQKANVAAQAAYDAAKNH